MLSLYENGETVDVQANVYTTHLNLEQANCVDIKALSVEQLQAYVIYR
jgi:hypothetical protein